MMDPLSNLFEHRSKLVIWVVLVFNLFTILIYATAPLNYDRSAYFYLTIGYLLFSMLIIYKGYKWGIKRSVENNENQSTFLRTLSPALIQFVFIFYSLTFLLRYAYLLRFYPWEVREMIQFLAAGFIDPYWAYHIAIDDPRPFTISWTTFFLTSIINQIFFIFCFISWNKQRGIQKLLTVLFVSVEIFYWKGRATNFGIISLIIIFVLAQLVKNYNGSVHHIHKRKPRTKRLLFIAVLMFSLAIFSFSRTMSGRTNDADATGNFIDTNGYVFSILPESSWNTYYYVVSYLGQGYNNLSLALSLEATPWTYGMGNNPALMSFSDLIIGGGIMNRSYMSALDDEFNVDKFAAWHSAYLWWANDVTIIGVPLVLFFLAYCMGVAFKRSILLGDFLSKVVFVVLCAMLLTLFANNTFLSNIFYSFMFIFPIWITSRLGRNGKKNI